MEDPQDPIVVVQEFEAPISAVWRAITDPERMRVWYFDAIADFRAKPRFEARFNVHVEGTGPRSRARRRQALKAYLQR